ncbi:MAG: glycosyltransferase [Candidatus Zhuqueibacterota bacterium]
MLIFYAVTAALIAGYGALLFRLIAGLGKLKPGRNAHQYTVSVIVAARNEEQNIRPCLDALVQQTYPVSKYEIIIIDDRSSDSTATVVESYCQRFHHIKLARVKSVPAGIAPKKNALQQGIAVSQGEIILTTDADCVPAPGWISAMVSYFEPSVGLVAGFSPLEQAKSQSVFTRLMTLDSLSLAAVAAGSFGMGRPLTCSGRNLGYRRETFHAVGGFKEFQHFVSGDDDLLLHRIRQHSVWDMRYAATPEAIVRSLAPTNLRQFANQRIRHASKGRFYAASMVLGLIGVYLLNFNLLCLLLLSLTFNKYLLYWVALMILKSLPEFLLITRFARFVNCTKILRAFPWAMLAHVPYVVIFGLLGQLGKFQWKDETFTPRANRT